MKALLKEIQQLQKIAGLITESEINEINDIQVMRKVDKALKAGQTVTVQGKPVEKISTVTGNMTLKDGGTVVYLDLEDPIADILIDGEAIVLEPTQPYHPDPRTPEEKEAAKQAWQDRYGPGGGYDVPSGAKYTGD